MDFIRKQKEKLPVLAICYDFDKTLSPDDMQAQGYIQSVGYDVKTFWDKSNKMAQDNDMDTNLAYMYTMMTEAEGNLPFTKKTLAAYGAKVKFFNGVETWFERIRAYGKVHGVIVEHYIISSGLKEMIEGTPMAKMARLKKYTQARFITTNVVLPNGLHKSSITQAKLNSCSALKKEHWTSTIQQ